MLGRAPVFRRMPRPEPGRRTSWTHHAGETGPVRHCVSEAGYRIDDGLWRRPSARRGPIESSRTPLGENPTVGSSAADGARYGVGSIETHGAFVSARPTQPNVQAAGRVHLVG